MSTQEQKERLELLQGRASYLPPKLEVKVLLTLCRHYRRRWTWTAD